MTDEMSTLTSLVDSAEGKYGTNEEKCKETRQQTEEGAKTNNLLVDQK